MDSAGIRANQARHELGGRCGRRSAISDPDPRNPSKIIGFEVDIAEALAKRMGRTAHFVQNQWDGLVPGLERSEYDMVIAGLEITPERLAKINFSTPYYYSTLSLTVRLDETRIRKPEDLTGHRVGTLKATLAERYLNEMVNVDVPTYDNQLHPYLDLMLGRLDAVVLDTPIALYYAYSPQMRNVELTSVKFPIAIGIRKADTALLAEVNMAMESMKADGTLKSIYQQWGMYNSATADYLGDKEPVTNPNPVRYEEYLQAEQTAATFVDRLEQYWSLPAAAAPRCGNDDCALLSPRWRLPFRLGCGLAVGARLSETGGSSGRLLHSSKSSVERHC